MVAGAPQANYLPSAAVNGLSRGLPPDSGGGIPPSIGCDEGREIHFDGTCADPLISRKLYLFFAPEQPDRPPGPSPTLPRPKVNRNYIYVRLPEDPPAPEPIVIPPPRRKTLLYVLRKLNERTQRVIEVPSVPSPSPQVYFINYQDGENPSLPIGVHIDTVLGVIGDTGGEGVGGTGGDSFGLVRGVKGSSVGLRRGTGTAFGNNGGAVHSFNNSNRDNRGFISRAPTHSGLYSRS